MRRRWNKIMALLLASAVLTANVGVVSTFAAGDEKTEQSAQKDESEETSEDSEKNKEEDKKTTQTAAPTATVKEGTYSETQKITLKSSAKDAVIYYTTDGKEPTEKSTRFDAKKPIEVKKTTTIKAIAVSKETGKSKIATFTYKIGESDKKEESKETPAAEQTPSATPTTAPTEIPKQAQTSSEQG
ncbi:MAG: chitobiase/beta-hexosaminidase C-terminal domain-containing protein, partial [Clostridiales bacterium]|nr:chitobiase/beta-hexosaminidase C-terminal domain-containing protein [Clostridiales bacterium]